jgi:hypothetical protein
MYRDISFIIKRCQVLSNDVNHYQTMSSILTCVCLSVRDNSFSVGLVIADAIADATRADAIGPPQGAGTGKRKLL